MTDLTDYRAVTALLERHGFRFSRSLGQNFLTAAWVPERIADEADIIPGDGVLEVGPGVGCLTAALARRAGKVLALELDERLRGVLKETLADFDNVSVVFADAVKADLAALCREHLGERPWRVCANLPYNVTTPLLTAFLKAGCFESVTVMVQKEVAQRLCARPGTGEYGAFTLLVQWYTEPELLFDVPPHCFVPQPKVTSAVKTGSHSGGRKQNAAQRRRRGGKGAHARRRGKSACGHGALPHRPGRGALARAVRRALQRAAAAR